MPHASLIFPCRGAKSSYESQLLCCMTMWIHKDWLFCFVWCVCFVSSPAMFSPLKRLVFKFSFKISVNLLIVVALSDKNASSMELLVLLVWKILVLKGRKPKCCWVFLETSTHLVKKGILWWFKYVNRGFVLYASNEESREKQLSPWFVIFKSMCLLLSKFVNSLVCSIWAVVHNIILSIV